MPGLCKWKSRNECGMTMSVRDYRGLQPRNDNREATRDILSLRLATLPAHSP